MFKSDLDGLYHREQVRDYPTKPMQAHTSNGDPGARVER